MPTYTYIFEQEKNGVFLPRHNVYSFDFTIFGFITIANPIHMLRTRLDSMHLIQLNVFRSLAHAHGTSTIIRKIEAKRNRKQNILLT